MQLDCEELRLESLIEYFYTIPGVPSMPVKPAQLNAGLQYSKVFIQSTLQGSRYIPQSWNKFSYLSQICTAHIWR